MRCTVFWCRRPPSCCSAWWRMGTLAAALLHGPALAGLGIVGAFATPILVSSGKPDFWALYIYLAIVTAAAFGLARIRLWRWLAVTTIAFALLWTFPCLQCGPSMVGAARVPRARRLRPRRAAGGVRVHVRAARGGRRGRADLVRLARGLSARRRPDRAEQLSCRHCDDRVRPAGGRQSVRRLAQRRRRRRGRRRRGVGLCRVRRMGRARQSGHAGAARRPVAGHRTDRHGRIGVAASDISRDLRRRLWRRGLPRAGPRRGTGHSGDLVGRGGVHAAGAAGRALRPHRASRPLDSVRDSRRDAGREPLPLRPRSSASARTGRGCRPPSRCSRPARSRRSRWR